MHRHADAIADAFPLIQVQGSALHMGRQHGEQAADRIRRYLSWIEKSTGLARDKLVRRALGFEPAIHALSAAYLEEVRGLAQGARITYGEALLCQVRGEAAHAQHGEGCTAFALRGEATRGGAVLAGQNQDLPAEFADLGIILRVRPADGRPPAIMFTFAGQLGYMGMNVHGVAHFANALPAGTWRQALPHYPLKRVLLEQSSWPSCLRVLTRHRVSSAANMVFCDGDGRIGDVEIRPERVMEYHGPDPDLRLHTNHYLAPGWRHPEPEPRAESVHRLERLRQLITAHWGSLDVRLLQRILGDHSGDPAGICRHGEGGTHSICGYIAEPGRHLFHVRRGHGCLGTWTTYEL